MRGGPVKHPRPAPPAGPWLVVGLARSGTAAAELLRRCGEEVIAVDAAAPPGAEGLRALGVEVHLDAEGLELLDRVAAVVKSPGVPAEAPVVAAAREADLPVLGELELGWRLLANRTVAVTGTNGKTTVSEWLGHVWRRAGEPVAVAGNVGTPLTALVGRVESGATVICECSSFQLEDSQAFAPEVAVLLNVTPDHLDRHGSYEAYREAKLAIFRRQPEGAAAVWDVDRSTVAGAPPGDAERWRYGIDGCGSSCMVSVRDGVLIGPDGPLLEADEVALAGEHNLRNAMAVAAAALAAGLSADAVAAGLRDFTGVPHRLEKVAEVGGVSWVNDSKATNVDAAEAAIRAYEGGVRVILGGSLKGAGFGGLRGALEERCLAAYLIGEAAPALRRDLAASSVPMLDAGSLERAVELAAAEASPGETVLLAPACASFDAFRDYEDRGERFRELVRELAP